MRRALYAPLPYQRPHRAPVTLTPALIRALYPRGKAGRQLIYATGADPDTKTGPQEIVLRPEIEIRWSHDPSGKLVAGVTCATKHGPFRFAVTVDYATILIAVHDYMARQASAAVATGADFETAGFFDAIKKIAKKVAKATAIDKVIKQVKKIQKNPVIARAVGLGTVVVPGSGAAMKAISSAGKIIASVSKGDVRAIADVKRLSALAEAGFAPATKAMRVIRNVQHFANVTKAITSPQGIARLLPTYAPRLLKQLGAQAPHILSVVKPLLLNEQTQMFAQLASSAPVQSALQLAASPAGRAVLTAFPPTAPLGIALNTPAGQTAAWLATSQAGRGLMRKVATAGEADYVIGVADPIFTGGTIYDGEDHLVY